MENLPAHKDQYTHWPEPLKQVQLARIGEYFKDINTLDVEKNDIAQVCQMIADEHELKIEDMERLVNWLKTHYPYLRLKQFNLAFELYDTRQLSEKYFKFRAFRLFTKEFVGIVLEGFKEYNQQKTREIFQLEQKEKAKTEGEPMTSDQRASSVIKLLKKNGVDIKMHTEELKRKDKAKTEALRTDRLNAFKEAADKIERKKK